ncbi:hypothetical protein BV25DRAFT_1827325 [Artomyces pyxidatus]|uniref:Uncharacterized protein n=1 Tax=Artomyces pyxidatus TaxID=48021 RepID=A0ACB8SXU8_9AGAM|nr:hypothetical protein BV25DRAFT_1827325 [Artomyces pyxidatus]
MAGVTNPLCLQTYLAVNNARIRHQQHTDDVSKGYPGKFCSIVKSAGTGKSRLVHELGEHGVVVLYMNFKERGSIESDSYPPCDEVLLDMLVLERRREEGPQVAAFLAAIFLQMVTTLTQMAIRYNGDHSQMIKEWQACMRSSGRSSRRLFFMVVKVSL